MSNRMRMTRAKTGHRRSHHKVAAPATTVNEDGVRHYKHRASAQTGKYRGRQVMNVEKDIAKKQKKMQETEAAQNEGQS